MGERRILLVEDNEVNRAVAVRFLQRLGYVVDTADDGRAALDAHARTSYDAILMDCHMPEMDGYDSAVSIRAQERDQGRTPIIALTANADAADRRLCLDSGMDDYLTKPIDLARLRETLERWITPRP